MQQNDAKNQQLASEFMRELLGMSPDDYAALAKQVNQPKPLPPENETLLERVQRVKTECNTIAQQRKPK